MPYKSQAQERFFHSAGAKKAGISLATVKEFDKASKGVELPKRKDGKSDMRRVKPAATRTFTKR